MIQRAVCPHVHALRVCANTPTAATRVDTGHPVGEDVLAGSYLGTQVPMRPGRLTYRTRICTLRPWPGAQARTQGPSR